MKPIYFAAFDGFSLISKLIKFWTRSEYSHIAYLKNKTTLIETWGDNSIFALFKIHWKKVIGNPFMYHKKGTVVEIWELYVDNEIKNEIDSFFEILAKNKTKYDYLGVLSFILKIKKDEFPKRFFCSEGCITPLVKNLKWDKIKPYTVSPYNFVEIIQAAGGQLIKTIKL